MSWNVLVYVNRSQNSKKFWSFNLASGEVVWGRLGSPGTIRTFEESVIRERALEKITDGYKVFSSDYPNPSPPEREVMEFWYGAIPPSDDPTGAVGRARQEQERRRSQPQVQESLSSRSTSQNYFSENVSGSYKTDNRGYIKAYRQGYQRFVVNQVRYISVGKEEVRRAPARFKKFYDSIPINQVVEKRPFGFEFDSEAIFGRRAGQYKFVVEEQTGKIVGCFEIVRSTGRSNFFYVKTNSENYDSLVKNIVYMMATVSGQPNIQLNTQGETLAKSLNSLYDWDEKNKSGNLYSWMISIKKVKLENESNNPARYQELIWK